MKLDNIPRLTPRERLMAFLVIASVSLLGAFAIFEIESARVSHAQERARARTAEQAHAIEERFHAVISANYALAAVIQQSGGKVEHFEVLADGLLRYHRGVIQNLQLAPQGIVSQIYPLAGNEKAIGHNLLTDPTRRDDALKAIRTRSLTLSGPMNLRQGGNGMIARLPVFLAGGKNHSQERFWGFVTALILTPDFLKTLDLGALDSRGYFYQLTKAEGDKTLVIAANTSGHPLRQGVSATVKVPNGIWELTLAPKRGWIDWPSLAVELALLTGLIVIAWHFVLAQIRDFALQRELAERTRQVEELNATLAQRVEQEVAAGREKDLMLIQQSRFAEMGEMIGNIAHQWRQPLNTLSILIANLKDDCNFNELSPERMEAYAAEAKLHIQQMAQTIDDFRDFFRPRRDKVEFSLGKAAAQALQLTAASMRDHNIAVSAHGCENLNVLGYPNEFSQVLVNLLNNAQQAITGHGETAGRIDLRCDQERGMARLTVADNGGGIPPEALPNIFEPFFTTKEQGTGLGLPMVRMILETHMGGSIETRNAADGAEFVIRLPLAASPEGPANLSAA